MGMLWRRGAEIAPVGTSQGCHFAHVVARAAPLNQIPTFYLYLFFFCFNLGLAFQCSGHSNMETYLPDRPVLRTNHHLKATLECRKRRVAVPFAARSPCLQILWCSRTPMQFCYFLSGNSFAKQNISFRCKSLISTNIRRFVELQCKSPTDVCRHLTVTVRNCMISERGCFFNSARFEHSCYRNFYNVLQRQRVLID